MGHLVSFSSVVGQDLALFITPVHTTLFSSLPNLRLHCLERL